VVQIESDAKLLGRFTPFRIQAVYGGIDYAKQRETLAAGCDLLVGTPGRLIDYLTQRVWSPRHVELLVIDEADRMFDMGFIADLHEAARPVLVATDAARRGLRIEAVSPVINCDLPQDAEAYVRRIGRTARAGAGGKAISLVDEASALNLEAIEKFIGQKIPVEWADDAVFLQEIRPTAEERRRYAEERRARLAARDRFGDRGRREHARGAP